MKRRSAQGSITGFVAVIMLAILACSGLVIDGARIIGAKVTAADHAENAARAGAQEVTALRSGGYVIDEAKAQSAASAYLSAHGVSGSVITTPTQVSVTVTDTVHTTLLALVGVGSKSVSATRSSVAVTK